MRLFLLLILLPCMLFAQKSKTADERNEKRRERVRLRAGVALQFDGKANLYYTRRINDVVPYYARTPLISGVVNWTPITDFPGFRTQFRLTYDRFNFLGNNQRIGHNHFGEGFVESLDYKHLQAAAGLLVELFPHHDWSPYFSSHLLMSVPLSIRYAASRTFSQLYPSTVAVKGGARISPGWEAGFGLRAYTIDHVTVSIGIYYTQQAIIIDWPNLTGRDFRQGTVMRTHAFGCNITGQYSW